MKSLNILFLAEIFIPALYSYVLGFQLIIKLSLLCYSKISSRNNGYFILVKFQERNLGRCLCSLFAVDTGKEVIRARKEGSPLTVSAVANTDIKDHMNNVSLSIFKVVIQKKLIDLVTEFQILSLLN